MSNQHLEAEKESAALLRDITALSEQYEIDEFTIHQITNRCKKIMQADPEGANTALGALEALKGNIEKSKEYHELALKLSDDIVCTLKNYASSLAHLHCFNDALEKITLAFEYERENLLLLHSVIRYAFSAGLIDQAHHYLDLWNKQSPDESHEIEETISSLYSLLQEKEIDEESINKAVNFLLNLPRSEGYKFYLTRIMPFNDNISYQVEIKGTPTEAVKLNEKFARSFLSDTTLTDKVKDLFTGTYIAFSEDASIPC